MSKNDLTPSPSWHPAARKWFKGLCQEYAFGVADLAVVRCAADAMSRMLQAQDTLTTEGLTINDRYGTRRCHPMVAVERDSRLALLRAIHQLGLDEAEAAGPVLSTQPLRAKIG